MTSLRPAIPKSWSPDTAVLALMANRGKSADQSRFVIVQSLKGSLDSGQYGNRKRMLLDPKLFNKLVVNGATVDSPLVLHAVSVELIFSKLVEFWTQ